MVLITKPYMTSYRLSIGAVQSPNILTPVDETVYMTVNDLEHSF